MESNKSSSQFSFPEEQIEAQTWLLFFCNPLLKEIYVELLESHQKYRETMNIKHFYYFHPRLQTLKMKKSENTEKKEQIEQCPVFECKEVAIPAENMHQQGQLQERRAQKLVSQPYQFHHNLVDNCVAIQFTEAKPRFWLEENLGLGLYPMEFVKSVLNIDQLNRNNLREWEKTMPYTEDDQQQQQGAQKVNNPKQGHQHILFISFDTTKAAKSILENSSLDE